MPLPDIVLPPFATGIGRRLPGLPPRFALVKTLNLMLERGLPPTPKSLPMMPSTARPICGWPPTPSIFCA